MLAQSALHFGRLRDMLARDSSLCVKETCSSTNRVMYTPLLGLWESGRGGRVSSTTRSDAARPRRRGQPTYRAGRKFGLGTGGRHSGARPRARRTRPRRRQQTIQSRTRMCPARTPSTGFDLVARAESPRFCQRFQASQYTTSASTARKTPRVAEFACPRLLGCSMLMACPAFVNR